MNDSEKEKMLDLLIAKATTGLSKEEAEQLKNLEEVFPELKDDTTFEFTAAAINLADFRADDPMPAHLQAKILADAEKYFAAGTAETPVSETSEEEYQKTFTLEPKHTTWNWLGWLVAAAACIVLAVNLWLTRTGQPAEIAKEPPAQTTPAPTPSLAEQRQQLLAAANDVIQTTWTEFDPKQPRNIQGDVVWSNSLQKGFLRFRGLPPNNPNKETYQLWIFDKTQKNPISGGVFDAPSEGEIIIPIDSALQVQQPFQFAVTAEKPGGVMVSELGKVMTIAKVEI